MTQVSPLPKHYLSDKVEHFTESVIREMTRQAMLHGAINLAQGFPDFAAPAEIKKAAQEAIEGDVNQYPVRRKKKGGLHRQAPHVSTNATQKFSFMPTCMVRGSRAERILL